MSDRVTLFRGKPLPECTYWELVECVRFASAKLADLEWIATMRMSFLDLCDIRNRAQEEIDRRSVAPPMERVL